MHGDRDHDKHDKHHIYDRGDHDNDGAADDEHHAESHYDPDDGCVYFDQHEPDDLASRVLKLRADYAAHLDPTSEHYIDSSGDTGDAV